MPIILIEFFNHPRKFSKIFGIDTFYFIVFFLYPLKAGENI